LLSHSHTQEIGFGQLERDRGDINIPQHAH
jgi:hypothetical protein